MADSFELAIVGGSVAGSVCAQVLGSAGVKVAIFDYSHPREKPCGGLIDGRTVEEFDIPRMYLENEVKSCIYERYFFRKKLPVVPSMFLVSRRDFDGYLLQKALASNNVVLYPEKVDKITRDQDTWIITSNRNTSVRTRFLIGADGCPSLVRKSIMKPISPDFLATTVGYILHCSSKFLRENFEPYTVEAYYSHHYVQKEGFIWIFPKRNSINIGIGGLAQGRQLKQSLDNFLFSHDAGKRFASLNRRLFAGLVPIIRNRNFFEIPCAGNNWALIGDAAGHVDAIGGAGIYYAMKGGLLCAKAFLDGNLRSFEKLWREDYGYELYYVAANMRRYYGGMGPFIWLQYCLQSSLNF